MDPNTLQQLRDIDQDNKLQKLKKDLENLQPQLEGEIKNLANIVNAQNIMLQKHNETLSKIGEFLQEVTTKLNNLNSKPKFSLFNLFKRK